MNLDRIHIALVVLFSVLVLASCAPVPRDFYKPLHEEGTLISRGCGSSGPPDTIKIFLAEGVEIQMWASSTDSNTEFDNFYLFSSINAPEGVELQLDRDYIIVKDNNTSNSWQLNIDFLSTNKKNYLGSPNSILKRSYQGLSEDLIERVKNSDQENGYIRVPALSKISGKTYSYSVLFGGERYFNTGMSFSISTRKILSRLQSFSVSYPEIMINGTKISLDEIRFDRVQYIGIDPLNC